MYLPKLQPQLGRGQPVPGRTQGSRDCGVRTVQMMADTLTHGRWRPGVHRLRQLMGRPGPQMTNVSDAKAAIESRAGLHYAIRRTVEEVKRGVERGHPVQACVAYGVFSQEAGVTGDPLYQGGHSILVLGQRTRHGVVQWHVWDPLMDGRRGGIAQGPVWVSRWAVVRGLRAFGSGGQVWAGVAWRRP